jgi:hypothetical protein
MYLSVHRPDQMTIYSVLSVQIFAIMLVIWPPSPLLLPTSLPATWASGRLFLLAQRKMGQSLPAQSPGPALRLPLSPV